MWPRPSPLHIPHPPPHGEYYPSPSPSGSQHSPRYRPSATSPHFRQFAHPHHVAPPPNEYHHFVSPGLHHHHHRDHRGYEPPGAFDYGGYSAADPSLDPRSSRRRARSRASSKASSANYEAQSEPPEHAPHRARSRRRRPRRHRLQPTVESAPNSPPLLPTLPSDTASLMESDEEYIKSLPPSKLKLPGASDEEDESPRDFNKWLMRNRHRLMRHHSAKTDGGIILERERKPYAGSTATASTAASSPPPADTPMKERERRQYATYSEPPPIIEERERERRQYASHPEPSPPLRPAEENERERRQYASHAEPSPPPVVEEIERERRQYSSRAEPSPPQIIEEAERERRQYSTRAEPPPGDHAPEIVPKKRNPYSYSPQQHNTQPSSKEERRRSRKFEYEYSPAPTPQSRYDERSERRRSGNYSSTGADMQFAREDPRSSYESFSQPYRGQESPRQHHHHDHSHYDDRGRNSHHDDRGRNAHYEDRGRKASVASSHGTATSFHSARQHTPQSVHSSPVEPTPHQPPPPPPPPAAEPESQHSLVRVPSEEDIQDRQLESPYLDLIPSCPKRKMVTRGEWFILASVPSFFVCERCYELHIHNTRFRHEFDTTKLIEGERAYCAFNTPRVLDHIWPAAKEHQSFEIFETYALQRAQLTNCTAASSSAHGIWYCIKEQYSVYTIGKQDYKVSLLACQACYEDVIAGSDFAPYFERRAAANPEGLNSCHISVPYIEAQFLDKALDWPQFLRNVDYRLKDVTQCPLDGVVSDTQRPWFKPHDTRLPIYICESCYCDGIVPTDFCENFDQSYLDPSEDVRFCSMGAFTLTVIWEQAVERHDMGLFINAAEAAWGHMCEPDGSVPGPNSKEWHELIDPNLSGFLICTRCIKTYFEPLGFGGSKTRPLAQLPPPPPGACALSSHYRREIVSKLAEAASWRDFSIFAAFIEHRIARALCPGTYSASRKLWFGFDDFRACEECYKFRIQVSPFAPQVRTFKYPRPQTYVCDLGDEEGRAFWDLAKKKGDLGFFMQANSLRRELEHLKDDRKRIEKRLLELKEDVGEEMEVRRGRGRGGIGSSGIGGGRLGAFGGRGAASGYMGYSLQDELRSTMADAELLRRAEDDLVNKLNAMILA